MDNAPTRIKGPELDDMFMKGMTGIIGGSLLMGTANGMSQMLGPGLGPIVGTALKIEAMDMTLRTVGSMVDGPRRQPQMAPAPGMRT
jgi:hypothetical protein